MDTCAIVISVTVIPILSYPILSYVPKVLVSIVAGWLQRPKGATKSSPVHKENWFKKINVEQSRVILELLPGTMAKMVERIGMQVRNSTEYVW